MSRSPDLVWFHVGLHKTGTTYLQNLLRTNRDGVRAQGVFFSAGKGSPVQAFAVSDLQGRRIPGVRDPRIPGSWKRLVDTVNGCGQPAALISDERLGLCTPRQVARAVKSFPGSEVRVIVTARDLARSVVSGWQDEVKNGQVWTWQEFVDSVRDPSRAGENPNRGFWRRHDVVQTCALWAHTVGADRVTVVTVPPAGSPPDLLVRRFMSVVGVDADDLELEAVWTNANVDLATTEVMRRLNGRLAGRLNRLQQDQVVKFTLGRLPAGQSAQDRPTLPAAEFDWVERRAREFAERIAASGYQVVGELEDLLPRRTEGRRPDDVSDDQIVQATIEAMAAVARRLADEPSAPTAGRPA